MGGFDPNAERNVWWIGTSSHGPDMIQNDVTKMWANGVLLNDGSFDFRPDDYPDEISNQPIIPNSGALTIEGVISPYAFTGVTTDGSQQPDKVPDKDFFAVSLPGTPGLGQWAVEVNVADVGPNLDARIEVYDFNGNLVATADPGNSLDAKLSLGGGNYWIAVMGHNHPWNAGGDQSYSDMGTYTMTVEFTEPYFEEFILPKYPFRFLEDPYQLYDVFVEIAGQMEMDTKDVMELIGSMDTSLLLDYTYEALSSDALKTSLQEYQETDGRTSDAERDGTLTMTRELSAALNDAFTRGLEELLTGDLRQTTATR
jgi:hypothetical protein